MKSLKCPVCDNISLTPLNQKVVKLYKCNACTHTFTILEDKPPLCYTDKYFEQTHKNWFENPNYQLFELIYCKLFEFIDEEKIKLLDVGCGNGAFLKYIHNKNPEVELWGIDLKSNEHPHINFIKGDFYKERIDYRFNVVSSLAMIEHVDNLKLYINKLSELLRPDGILFVTTVNNNSLIYKLGRSLDRIGLHTVCDRLYDPHHLQHFTIDSLKKVMELNDFDVIFTKIHNYPMKAVDVLHSNFFIKKFYIFGVFLSFLISEPLNCGYLQTILCKKHSR